MQTFDTPAPIRAVLDLPAGRIQVIAADRADSTVEVRPANAASSRDITAAEQSTVAYADGVLTITASTPHTPLRSSSGSVEVTVQLPAGSRIEATAASAELHAVGRLGEVAFRRRVPPDRDRRSRQVSASRRPRAMSRSPGSPPADISTTRGDIRIGEAAGGTVVLRTQSGSIVIAAAGGVSASLDARTGQGRISNALKNDGTTDLAIRATTSHGDITATSL